ncbi:hypothetical protein Tco_1163816 [Tanacetum coccineum]
MLVEEMKLTKHYQLYALVFGVDVPTTQSQSIESTQGTHRPPSAPRPPNPFEQQGKSSAPRKPTIIRIRRRSQPDPETPIPTAAKIDIASLDEATQMSIATERGLADLEAQQNVKRVEEHLVDTEIERIVEGNNDVDENQFVDEILNSQEDPDTSDEEEEEESAGDALIIRKGKGIVEIKDIPPPPPIRSPRTNSAFLSLDKEELQELTASDPTPSSFKPTTSSPKPKSYRVKQYKSVFQKMSRRYGYMFRHLKQSFMPMKDFKAITEVVHATLKRVVPSIVDKTLNDIMKKNIPKIVADKITSERQKVQNDLATLVADAIKKEQESIRAKLSVQVTHDVETLFLRSSSIPDLQHQLYLKMKDDVRARDANLAIWLSLKIKFQKLVPLVEPCRVAAVRTRDHEDHHDDDARSEGESSAKIQRTPEHETFTTGESSSSQAMNESTPSGSGTQEQLKDCDAWQDGQVIDDDEVPDEEVSLELLDEVFGKVMTYDELHRMQYALNNMLRSRCEEHKYHLDQIQIYMESQRFWESRE